MSRQHCRASSPLARPPSTACPRQQLQLAAQASQLEGWAALPRLVLPACGPVGTWGLDRPAPAMASRASQWVRLGAGFCSRPPSQHDCGNFLALLSRHGLLVRWVADGNGSITFPLQACCGILPSLYIVIRSPERIDWCQPRTLQIRWHTSRCLAKGKAGKSIWQRGPTWCSFPTGPC